MKRTLLSLALVGGVAFAVEGDPEAGRAKFYLCKGCHGIPGYSNVYPTYHVPKVGGQHADYIVAALKAYAKGERQHGSMEGNSALSEQDMLDIATYLSQLKTKGQEGPITGDPKRGKKLSEKCAGCHGEDGLSPAPQFPILANQYESYLIKAMKDYQTGARKKPIMQGMVQGLSEEDLRDIAAWYASRPRGLTVVRD